MGGQGTLNCAYQEYLPTSATDTEMTRNHLHSTQKTQTSAEGQRGRCVSGDDGCLLAYQVRPRIHPRIWGASVAAAGPPGPGLGALSAAIPAHSLVRAVHLELCYLLQSSAALNYFRDLR